MKNRLNPNYEPPSTEVQPWEGCRVFCDEALIQSEGRVRVQSEKLDIVVYGIFGDVVNFVNTLRISTTAISRSEEVKLTVTRLDFLTTMYDAEELIVLMKYSPSEVQRQAALAQFQINFPQLPSGIANGSQTIQRAC